ncbi:DUF2487 family protein [Salirhabdus salicampi]|uniref:DUF2487 family protein n=1 Tax=Salirhabdus salicampi TaxID=476102 RepID=UPI0020C37A46|nr:DUF2487 family protein [Salirhabdus salicampi]MCP8616690.1 YpiF family protein [Salirhabdus salicampi]
MNWSQKDVKQYVKAKEYIDTAIIPLLPFALNKKDEELEKMSLQKEMLDLITYKMENTYKGRMFLFPAYMYLETEDLQNECLRLNQFAQAVQEQPFKHLFYVTPDFRWKKVERDIDGHLLWLPMISNGDVKDDSTQTVIQDQVTQMTDLIRSFWTE